MLTFNADGYSLSGQNVEELIHESVVAGGQHSSTVVGDGFPLRRLPYSDPIERTRRMPSGAPNERNLRFFVRRNSSALLNPPAPGPSFGAPPPPTKLQFVDQRAHAG